MNNHKKLCIVGTGGFGRETLSCFIDSVEKKSNNIKELVCFMEKDECYIDEEIMGVEVIPQSKFDPSLYNVVIAIGDPIIRKKVVESLPSNTTYATVIHPTVVISEWASIGEGSIVAAGTIVTCNIKIGKHAHLNLHTTIGHDCRIGDYFTTAPAVNISGNCVFGNAVYIGTNASVKQGITICDNVVIGMGGIVTKNITEQGVYIGCPVNKLEK